MCAINGFTGSPDRALIERMNAVTAHRGPDGTGIYEAPGVTLGHNRLAIIDPDPRAAQPMTDASGRYTIVFNGEIFNFKELKARFSSYPYRMESDTEAILAGWAEEGPALLPRLSGIFAFALWDADTKTLFLARDAAGVNPLYYRIANGVLAFSSEIKSILEDPHVPRTFDRRILDTYMRLLYIPGPATAFDEIETLAPGCLLTFAHGKKNITTFAPDMRQRYPESVSFPSATARVRAAVAGAVKGQMLSDRPLGLLLSGGFDSTIVLSEAVKHTRAIDTFTVAWKGLANEKAETRFNADARIARETAMRYGTRHHVFELETDAVASLLEEAVWHLDVPVSSASMVSQLALAKFTKGKVDVVLSGDGGDELFGGYERYRLSLVADVVSATGPLRAILAAIPGIQKFAEPPDARRVARHMFLKEEEVAPVFPHSERGAGALTALDTLLNAMPPSPFTQKMIWLDRESWLVDHSLVRTNKMSMAAGLEQRVPLLDDSVRAVAESLPLSYKVTPFDRKRVLHAAFADVLAPIAREPKRGWFSPGAKWLRRGELPRLAREALSKNYWEGTAECFDFEVLGRYLDEHQSGRGNHATVLWAVLTFQLWAKRFSMYQR